MTLQELSDELNMMPEDKRDQFMRDIRMLWATGKVTIDDYENECSGDCKNCEYAEDIRKESRDEIRSRALCRQRNLFRCRQ